jgi:hypothetical protein
MDLMTYRINPIPKPIPAMTAKAGHKPENMLLAVVKS